MWSLGRPIIWNARVLWVQKLTHTHLTQWSPNTKRRGSPSRVLFLPFFTYLRWTYTPNFHLEPMQILDTLDTHQTGWAVHRWPTSFLAAKKASHQHRAVQNSQLCCVMYPFLVSRSVRTAPSAWLRLGEIDPYPSILSLITANKNHGYPVSVHSSIDCQKNTLPKQVETTLWYPSCWSLLHGSI